ncbi:MAG: 4-hydroxy-3-methylbut-2-enyl diphosphate reductase [Candidatus Shapirobacteria bacterium]|jgi:4-hydroxy-3-methylbut-2-enyl diphosphate reductase|nr:4-hydroxy-3-methylbut-2-enyl diphosphate reductase [Candidatus Shapirobacteria bacterium]
MSKITIASPHGFCFGINRAINLAKEAAQKYKENIYFLGELVHNQHVVNWLETELKIKTVQSLDLIPDGSVVIIRAHGASPTTFAHAKEKDLIIVDASCPLVLKSHQKVKELSIKNTKTLFLCNSISHDETIGIVGENPSMITPITIKDIFSLNVTDPQNYVLITQTTLSTLETKEALDFIKNKYPQITIIPHICQATTDRQNAIIQLTKTCTLIIIVGSPTSANSNSLLQVAQSLGVTSYIIDSALEIDKKWFIGHQNIGISSGASTPESVLEEVIQKIN